MSQINVAKYQILKSCRVEYSDQEKCLPLLVVAGNGPSLWGSNWLNEVRLDWGCMYT